MESRGQLVASSRRVAWLAIALAVVATALSGGGRVPEGDRVPWFLASSHPLVRAEVDRSSSEATVERVMAALTPTMPPTAHLWTSYSNRYWTDEAAALWRSERSIQLLSFAPYRVPDDPSWAEDPFDDLAWQTHYHSLSWLQAPARAYVELGDHDARDAIRDYLMDWIGTHRMDAPSPRSWYDGAVRARVDVIVQLWQPVLADTLSGHEQHLVLMSLHEHGRLLHGYLADERFIGHNHALFHALSLHSLATAFPVLRDANTWRADARARVSSLLPEMVEVDEGVSLEQAANYHIVALRLFASADRYLAHSDDRLSDAEHDVLERMAEFGALLMTPAGTLPAIGDTVHRSEAAQRHLQRLKRQGFATPVSRYVLSRGREGERPSDAHFFPTAGYMIARPIYSDSPAWDRDLHLVVDTTAKSRPHGHHDPMNVLLYAEGSELLIDSGGPYAHGSRLRRDFVNPSAHNTVIVDGVEEPPGEPFDVEFSDDADVTALHGTFSIGPVENRRSVLLLKPDTVVIVDRLRSLTGLVHEFRLLNHLAPNAGVALDGSRGTVVVDAAGMGIGFATSHDAAVMTVRGDDGETIGWVTTGHAQRQPAPVISVVQRGESAWFVTALTVGRARGIHPPILDVEEEAGALSIIVGRAGSTWSLSLGESLSVERPSGE
jgi:hypothetical protein